MIEELVRQTELRTKLTKALDADGRPIRVGDFVEAVEAEGDRPKDRGLVTSILRADKDGKLRGGWTVGWLLGDMCVSISAGLSRVSNNHDKWRVIPHNELSFYERARQITCAGVYDDLCETPERQVESGAISAILSMMDEGVFDEYGDWPLDVGEALMELGRWLDESRSGRRDGRY